MIRSEPNRHPSDGGPKRIAWEEQLIVRCHRCQGTVIYKQISSNEVEFYHSCVLPAKEKE